MTFDDEENDDDDDEDDDECGDSFLKIRLRGSMMKASGLCAFQFIPIAPCLIMLTACGTARGGNR